MNAIGAPLDRADGRAKVTGTARYSAENAFADLAYAALVLSTIPAGRIKAIDTVAAKRAPGVLAIFTHENAPPAKQGKDPNEKVARHLAILQDDEVRYDRQPVALVVADTYERAIDAASRVRVSYGPTSAVTDFEHAETFVPPDAGKGPEVDVRGEPEAALATAALRVDNVYTTPQEHHNPMEPHATVALWHGDSLTVYDATQGVFPTRKRLAYVFDIPVSQVRVICPFVGGGFGCKGSVWPHTALAAMAARALKRPVKLTLERPEMFESAGYRPITQQRVALGAERTGKLVSTIHEVKTNTSVFDIFVEPCTSMTRMLYDVPKLRVKQTLVRLNFGTPTFMRLPVNRRDPSRSSRRWTNSRTRPVWIRSPCACAITPRSIPPKKFRIRASRCVNAMRSRPNASVGRNEARPRARCATTGNSWAGGWRPHPIRPIAAWPRRSCA